MRRLLGYARGRSDENLEVGTRVRALTHQLKYVPPQQWAGWPWVPRLPEEEGFQLRILRLSSVR